MRAALAGRTFPASCPPSSFTSDSHECSLTCVDVPISDLDCLSLVDSALPKGSKWGAPVRGAPNVVTTGSPNRVTQTAENIDGSNASKACWSRSLKPLVAAGSSRLVARPLRRSRSERGHFVRPTHRTRRALRGDTGRPSSCGRNPEILRTFPGRRISVPCFCTSSAGCTCPPSRRSPTQAHRQPGSRRGPCGAGRDTKRPTRDTRDRARHRARRTKHRRAQARWHCRRIHGLSANVGRQLKTGQSRTREVPRPLNCGAAC